MVMGNGPAGVALGGMRQHQDAEAVQPLDLLQLFHEVNGGDVAVGGAVQAGNVVNNDDAGAGGLDHILDSCIEVLGIAVKLVLALGQGVKHQPGKAGGK